MEFTAADIFQHSPFDDIVNSFKILSLTENSGPNYVRLKWEADDEEIRYPPTTHLTATVDDLTDVLDFDSEGIDGMDYDAGEDSESMGYRIPASSHDIYMVDTPKEDDGDNPEDKTPGQKPKRRHRRHSKSSNSKNTSKSTRRIDTPVNPEGNNDHTEPAMEQGEPGHENTVHSRRPRTMI